MKKKIKKFISSVLAVSQIFVGAVAMKVSATSPDEGVAVSEQLFFDGFDYETGTLTYASSGNIWEGTNSKSDPNVVTIAEDESGNKYASITERSTDGWGDGMRKYFPKVSSGKVRVSADIMMTAENSGQIEMTSSWNLNRALIKFSNGAFYGYADTDSAGSLSKKLISASLNTWYNIDIIADYTNATYDVLISQNDRLLYKEAGLPINDDNAGFSYLRFRNVNSGEFCVDNVVVEKVTAKKRENVTYGIYDTLDGYENFAEGGVPSGNLINSAWKDGAFKIGGTEIIAEEDGNKFFSIPSTDNSAIQYQIADTAIKTGLLRFGFSIKSTAANGAFVEVVDWENASYGGAVAMHIFGNNVYTRAGYWDASGSKVNAGKVTTDEWFDVELTYNLDENTYSIQLSRNGEVFACERDLSINEYNSATPYTAGIKVIRFRDWGTSTQIDNFEFEYLSEETEQDYIKTESNFDNYETIEVAMTGNWSKTASGFGETALVESNGGKSVSFAVSNTNNGIQYNIPGGFSSGEMVVNFSIKSNNQNGGALISFPSGTGNETGLVGLQLFKGSMLTYCNGYSATNKNLGKFTAGEWYDVSISLDMDQKLYNIQIKHDGEVLSGLKNLDLIQWCAPGNLMSKIGSIRFVDWGQGIGGAGYEMDNFSISYVNAESKKSFVVTESDFESSESLWAKKGWTADNGAALSNGKLSLTSGLSAKKALPLIDSGKIKTEYTVNAGGGKAEVLATGASGSFKLADFDGTTEDITVTNIIDLDNYKVTYYFNGANETTLDILDIEDGEALYNIDGILIKNTGGTTVLTDNLTVEYYVSKPTLEDESVTVTDAFGKVTQKGEIVNPGVDTIELDFDCELLIDTVADAVSLTSESGDIPEYTLSSRSGKCVLSFDKALNPEDTYTLSVSTNVKNINGESLEKEFSYSFTTDKAEVLVKAKAPLVGTKAIYTINQLNAGDILRLNADVVNSTENNADAVFVVAYYSGGRLVDAQMTDISFEAGTKEFDGVEFTVGELTGVDELKVFTWDSLTELNPYCEAFMCEDYLTSFKLYGEGTDAHTQGICTDNENGYLYHSSSHAIKKYDMKTGELIASTAVASEEVHFGDLVYNPDDGMIYGSAIVYGDENLGYLYVVDTEKLTELNMPLDTDGLIKLAYIPSSEDNYKYDADVDGAAIAPLPGAEADGEKYLYIAPQTNLVSGAHFSAHPVYDLEDIKASAVQFSEENKTHTTNAVYPTKIYHGYTGTRQFGAQTLCYIPEKNAIFANHYMGNAPGMPNFSKFLFDLNKETSTKILTGYTNIEGEVLAFGDYGITDVATGMKGSYETVGQHGMAYLGNNYFYISGTTYDGAMNTTASLYKLVDGEFISVQ